MAGEGQQVLALRAVLTPIVQQVLRDYGRHWTIRYVAPESVNTPAPSTNPLGGANKTKTAVVYRTKTIYGAAFQNDITRDTTRIGSPGSAIEVSAYNFYCAYDQYDFSLPGFSLIDPENNLEFMPTGDAQELGMVGLHVGWQLNLRAPSARGI